MISALAVCLLFLAGCGSAHHYPTPANTYLVSGSDRTQVNVPELERAIERLRRAICATGVQWERPTRLIRLPDGDVELAPNLKSLQVIRHNGHDIYPAAIHAPRVERVCEQTRLELRKIVDTNLFPSESPGREEKQLKAFEKEGPPNERPRYNATVAAGLAVVERTIFTLEHSALAGEQAAVRYVLPRLEEHRRGLREVARELEARRVIKGSYAATWYSRITEVAHGCTGRGGGAPFPGAA